MEVPSIEEEIKNDKHLSVVERYYHRRYYLNVRQPKDDYCILLHSNRVCLVTLAPSHPLITSGKSITKLDFKVNQKLDRLDNKVSGKWKHGAQRLQPTSPLALVELEDGTSYTLVPGITGKLLEVNEALVSNPGLMLTKPQGEGYVAIILPDISTADFYKQHGMTHDDYITAVQ